MRPTRPSLPRLAKTRRFDSFPKARGDDRSVMTVRKSNTTHFTLAFRAL
ncbi:hypothetical protein DT23_02255 [Thioclava indica]|uniref:Uncharacterized protein n=1 Tax=Thioclava indica TaxID=1353528 RepID=A0A074JZB4_9RHOB|nr:hypothetical protein DT23_02255 [Thioclava indica]